MGARRDRQDPPRHDDVHRRRPVHRELRLHRRLGNVYVGYAAHCAGLGEATDTDGCLADSLPLGTPVTFNEGGSLVNEGTLVGHGTLVYSSWLHRAGARHHRRQHLRLQRPRAGQGLRRRTSRRSTRRSRSGAARPASTPTAPPPATAVYTYGNSSLRAGVSQLSPHTGISLGDDAADGGWSHPLYT